MIINNLHLQNLRNHKKRKFEFSDVTNLIVGANTSGKSNILESIFMLSHGKSYRADRDTEAINWDSEIARMKSEVFVGQDKIGLEVVLTSGIVGGESASLKKFLVNGVPRRMNDFVGTFRSVIFSPEDIDIISDGPSIRRKYLDSVLILADKEYRKSLSVYEKALRQRNKLLERIRDENLRFTNYDLQMDYWDNLVIENGQYITKKRAEFINYLNVNEHVEHKIKLLENLRVFYDKSEISEARLDQYEREEVAAAATLVGPHRDDFKIFEGNRDIHTFGSRGEQRLSVLWLKLGELEYLSTGGERPVLLLDDIFSELDHEHRNMVLDIIPKQQTIITCTDLHLVEKDYLNGFKLIEL